MNMIYLDNSATTAPTPAVALAMSEAMTQYYGNPSSVHALGTEAKKKVTDARIRIMKLLGQKDESKGKLFFTSGGTESDNMATAGVVKAKNYRFRPRIITSASEHPAILEPLKRLESEGFEVIRIGSPQGVFDMEAYRDALTPETVLVSVMLVNNETGAVNDVKTIFGEAKKKVPGVVTHTDAVQGFAKLKFDPTKNFTDIVSASAHKIHGPKGIGMIWIAGDILKSKKIIPILPGGGQEEGYRSGTENVPAIVGFGAAAEEALAGMDEGREKAIKLRELLISGLPEGVKVNTPAGEYLPNIVSMTLRGMRSEVVVRYLSGEGICVSAGSACASNHRNISHVLTDFGLTIQEADSTIRVSLDAYNTEEEIGIFLEKLRSAITKLQKVR